MLRRCTTLFLIAAVLGLAAYPAPPPAQARALAVTPAPVGFAPSPNRLRTIELMGDYAYALSEYGNQIDIFSVADPAMPQLTAVYTSMPPQRSSFTDIAVTPDYLYLSTSKEGLRVLSLADPARPVAVGSIPPTLYEEFYGLTLGPGYLLLAADDGLRVLSLADPANPTQIGLIDWTNPDPGKALSAYDAILDGRYAYVSAGNWRSTIARYLFVVDLLDPTRPVTVPQSELRIDVNSLLEVRDGYGYLGYGSGATDALAIIDLRDPAAITTTGSLADPTGEWMSSGSGALFGSSLYLGTFDGVKVIDAADPAAPQLVGAALDGSWVSDVELRGRYLYVTDQHGLSILTTGLDLGNQLYLPAVPAAGG